MVRFIGGPSVLRDTESGSRMMSLTYCSDIPTSSCLLIVPTLVHPAQIAISSSAKAQEILRVMA